MELKLKKLHTARSLFKISKPRTTVGEVWAGHHSYSLPNLLRARSRKAKPISIFVRLDLFQRKQYDKHPTRVEFVKRVAYYFIVYMFPSSLFPSIDDRCESKKRSWGCSRLEETSKINSFWWSEMLDVGRFLVTMVIIFTTVSCQESMLNTLSDMAMAAMNIQYRSSGVPVNG